MTERCGCGEKLHYSNPETERSVRELVAKHGETVVVRVGSRAWHVPRHYIAAHGLVGGNVAILARRHGWEEADDD